MMPIYINSLHKLTGFFDHQIYTVLSEYTKFNAYALGYKPRYYAGQPSIHLGFVSLTTQVFVLNRYDINAGSWPYMCGLSEPPG